MNDEVNNTKQTDIAIEALLSALEADLNKEAALAMRQGEHCFRNALLVSSEEEVFDRRAFFSYFKCQKK